MDEKIYIQSLEAGMFVRNKTRRWLLSRGIDFKEDKGIFSSLFVMEGTKAELNEMVSKFKIDNPA